MRINGITALSYTRQGDELTATFTDTTLEALRELKDPTLTVTTDSGAVVEEITGYALRSIKMDLCTDTYEVMFTRASEADMRLIALHDEIKRLEELAEQAEERLQVRISTLNNQLTDIEFALVEVYEGLGE